MLVRPSERSGDPPDLNARFLQEGQSFLVERTRLVIRLGFPIYLGFWGLDSLVYPQSALLFIFLRLAVVAIFGLVYWAIRFEFGKKNISFLSVFVLSMASVAIALMTAVQEGFASNYYHGIMLTVFAAGFFMPWALRSTIAFSLITCSSYFVLNFALHGFQNLKIVAEPVFFLVFSCTLAGFATRAREVRRRSELILRLQLEAANVDLRALDEAKTRFFSNLSHELRTPLMLILGPLKALMQEHQDPKALALLQTAHANSQRLLRQVNLLLDASKSEAGQLCLHCADAHLGQLLTQLLSSLRPHASSRSITIVTSGLDDSPIFPFDSRRIEIVAANLLSNAVKFTPANGQVSLRVGFDDNNVFFEVEDTGPGIPQEYHAKVFERFFQVDDSSSRSYEGSGLGLAISRELIDLHGGDISLSSELNKGACFRVALPRVASTKSLDSIPSSRASLDSQNELATLLSDLSSPQMSSPPLSLSTANPSAPLVLIVEDNVELSKFIASELVNNYHIRTAPDGEVGLAFVRQYRPDIVVADIMMPRMDGLEFCRKLRESPEFASLPVLFLTARTGSDATVQGLRQGANDYLVKPFELAELRARIDALLRARSLQRKLNDRESRLAAIGEMTAKIVHDLRNPMTTIIALIETSTEGLQSGENLVEIVDDLRIVNSQAQRVNKMLSELLVFVRTGAENICLEPTNLHSFLSDTLSDLNLSPSKSKPSLICELDLPSDSCMQLDRTRIQRALENLVSNACDAICSSTPVAGNGKVWVKAAYQNDCLTVRVADNGCGIPKEMAEKIFNPFVTSGKRNGTGLGLATVRNLVRSHGGDVIVEPQSVEGGAAFTIRIPSIFPPS